MSLIFAGDFFFNSGKEPTITHEPLRSKSSYCSAFIVNLEGPVIEEDPRTIQKVGPIKHQSDRSINILNEMGVTAVVLANNHIMDGNREGIERTVYTLNKSNIDFFGIEGESKLLYKPSIRLNIEGKVLSIIGAAEEEFNGPSEYGCGAFIIDPIALWTLVTREIQEERVVIVVLHGGIEYEHMPPPWLRKLSHWLIDMGVTAVITHHPHVPGYVETYREKPIAWSLGNFWFSEGGGKDFLNRVGYVFELCISDGEKIGWKTYPYYCDYEQGVIREMKRGEKTKWNALIADIQDALSDSEIYQQWWDDLIENMRIGYIKKYSLAPLPNTLSLVLVRLFSLFKFENRWRLRQLNGLRCKSHREIWTQSLINNRYNERRY